MKEKEGKIPMGIIKKLLGIEEQETENEFLEVSGGSFWIEVEDTFFITGRGTVATGRVERGKLKVGEEV